MFARPPLIPYLGAYGPQSTPPGLPQPQQPTPGLQQPMQIHPGLQQLLANPQLMAHLAQMRGGFGGLGALGQQQPVFGRPPPQPIASSVYSLR